MAAETGSAADGLMAAETGSAADGLVAHVFTMSSNATLHDHHDPSQERKPARRSAANQARRRQAKSKAYQMQSALLAQQMSFDLPPSLDIKGQNATQSDNEGLGAGNERAGDGNAIAGDGRAWADGCAGIAWAGGFGPVPHPAPPAPSPDNLGDGGGGRPSQLHYGSQPEYMYAAPPPPLPPTATRTPHVRPALLCAEPFMQLSLIHI